LRTSQTIWQDEQLHEILRNRPQEDLQKLSQGFPSLDSQHELGSTYHANEQIKETLAVHKYTTSVQKEALAEDNQNRSTSRHELAGTKRANEQTKEAVIPPSSNVVAQTLAACTRCRVVGLHVPIFYTGHRLTSRSEKPDAIQSFPSADLAKGQAQRASTTTPAKVGW
jgi:hypothetical protein